MTGSSKKSTRRNAPWSYPRFHQGVMEDESDMEFTTITTSSQSELVYLYNANEKDHVGGGDGKKNIFLFTYFLVVDLNRKSSTGLNALLAACQYLV